MNIITVNVMGGLGNVMFQIATAYSVSLRDEMELLIDTTNYYGGKYGIDKYKKNVLRKIKFSEHTLNFVEGYGEKGHNYNEIPKFSTNSKLHGYFQSEKYFLKYKEEILNLFSPTKEILDKINKSFIDILKKPTTSIHVRRGDYLGLPNHHPVVPIDYYKNATSYFESSQNFLIFSDDLDWCKSNFDFLENKIFVENLDDYEELYLMSMCDNNIIANSTFSWWGAWMNTNSNKKVISPSVWFGQSLNYLDTTDIYCENWIKI